MRCLIPLVALVAVGQAQDESDIVQCASIECPSYNVLQRNAEYEVRHYTESNWVSNSQMAIRYDDMRGSSFRKLFNYIAGNNDQGVKVKMTAPVMTHVRPAIGPNCKSNFTRSFFVPRVHWGNIPTPLAEDVFLQNFGNTTIYARAFTGYATEEIYMQEVQKLVAAINDPSKHSRSYFFVGYDSPYKWWDRRHEVWFLAA